MVEDKEDPLESIVKKDHTKRCSLFGGDHGKDPHGKLCIKLKFPKEEEDEDEYEHKMMIGNTTSWEEAEEVAEEDSSQHQQQQNQNDRNGTVPDTYARICQVCGKGFKSGKALGGHMRVHFQRNKGLIFTTKKLTQPIIKKLRKLKKQEKRSDFFVSKKPNYSYKSQSEDGLDHEDYPCSICSKNFPSMKSLSGHMRCHPEREWRGIQPPSFSPPPVYNKVGSLSSSVSDPDQPHYSSSDDDDDDDAHVVDNQEKGGETDDLSKSLGNCWSVTAKRGRKSILDIKAKEETDEDDDEGMKEKNAICQLLSLSQHGFFEAYNQRVVKEEFETTNRYYEGIDRRVVSVDESKKKKRRRKKYDHHHVEELNRNEDDSKKKKSNLGVGIGVGTGTIEDHKGHVKKGIQGTDSLAGGKELEMNINWPNESAAEKKDFWYDEDGDDDSEKTHDNQQLMNLQILKHSDSITSPGNSILGGKSKKKRKKKKMKLTDLESVHHHDYNHDPPPHSTAASTVKAKGNSSSSPELEKFRCTTCDKCFSTHQALGGHRSSHNKSRMIIENALDRDYSTTAADEHEDDDEEDDENLAMEGIKELSGDDQQAEGAGSNSSNSKGQMVAEGNGCGGGEQDYHPCKICNKLFPSGQALGGHKRCHWINNATRNPITSSAGFEEAAIGRSGHHKVVEFDLNEKPPMEDADQDDVGGGTTGCGYASSNSIEYPFF